MKGCATILAIAGLCVAAVGCERKGEPVPTAYDPALDGGGPAPGPLNVDPEHSAARAFITGAPLTSGVPGDVGTHDIMASDPIEAAKQVVGRMIDAARAGYLEGMLAFYGDEEAVIMRTLLRAAQKLPAKMEKLEELSRTKLGMEMPSEVNNTMAFAAGGENPLKKLGEASPADFRFELSDKKVVVTSPDGRKQMLEKIGGRWRFTAEAKEKQGMSIRVEIFSGTVKLADALIAGIEDGSITKDNYAELGKKLVEQYLGQATKLFEEMAKATPPGPPSIVDDKGQAGPLTAPGPVPEVAPSRPKPGEETKPEPAEKKDEWGIVMGKTYRISSQMELYLGDDPFNYDKMLFLQPNTTIKFLEKVKQQENTRYKVEAKDTEGKKLGVGWLNPINIVGSTEAVD